MEYGISLPSGLALYGFCCNPCWLATSAIMSTPAHRDTDGDRHGHFEDDMNPGTRFSIFSLDERPWAMVSVGTAHGYHVEGPTWLL